MHVGYRYYDPATGRFLQRDPIGIAGGVNVYLYASNGPTIRVDANGLQSADDVLSCQDQCHRWVRTGGAATCTLHAGLQDCYNSCFKGHWPPGSVRPMPPNFTPWPGVCPPVGTGVPTPGTGKPGTPVAPPTNLPVNPPSSGCGGGGGSGGGGAAAMGFLLPLAFLVSLRFARSRSRWRRVDFTKRMDAR